MKARLPQGMGGGPGNLQSMIRQAQKMQEEAGAKQEELEAKEYTGTASGEMVTVTMTGKHEITALKIEPEVIDPDDAEMLADLVIAAVNEASRKASEDAEQQMSRIAGGMNVPGLF